MPTPSFVENTTFTKLLIFYSAADHSLICWGNGVFGALGTGNEEDVGDDEDPADVGAVNVTAEGLHVLQVCTSDHHTCVIVENGGVKWYARRAHRHTRARTITHTNWLNESYSSFYSSCILTFPFTCSLFFFIK